MSWDSGADLAWSCWAAAAQFIPPERMREAAEAFYDAAEGDFDLAEGAPAGDILGCVARHRRFVREGAPKAAKEGDRFVINPGRFQQRLVFVNGFWETK